MFSVGIHCCLIWNVTIGTRSENARVFFLAVLSVSVCWDWRIINTQFAGCSVAGGNVHFLIRKREAWPVTNCSFSYQP